MRWHVAAVTAVAAWVCSGCGDDTTESFDNTAGAGGFDDGDDGDGGDGDDDGDDGGDEGGGSGDDGAPPPEQEEVADFRVPRASGRWVYSASEATNSVAVIDSETLGIDVVGVGRGPTVVAPLAGEGRVAVLDQGSNDLAILRTDTVGTSVEVVPISSGANNLAVTPDGALAFVYHDVDGPEALGPGSDQEITVVRADDGVAWAMTVGVHPRDVVFTSDGSIAYVVTDDGVNVVPTADLAEIGKPDVIPVVADSGIDPSTLEIQVAPDEAVALSRIEGDDTVYLTDLVSGEGFSAALPGIATDLDIATDGSFAIVTLPALAGSRILELTLPLDGPPNLQPHDVGGEYVGLCHLAPDGDTMVLYTTVDPTADGDVGGDGGGPSQGPPAGSDTGGSTSDTGEASTGNTDGGSDTGIATDDGGDTTGGDDGGRPPAGDPRLRVTIARRGSGDWQDQITLFVDRPVAAVGIAPDSANAMLVHGYDETVPSAPWSYTLVDLTKSFPVKKLQSVAAEPGSILFTPEGDRAIVLLRDDAIGLRAIDLVDLRTFIVDGLTLGSPPEGSGYVDATDKIFVSQEHPTGRITFIDRDGRIETVTGFRLNDAVKD